MHPKLLYYITYFVIYYLNSCTCQTTITDDGKINRNITCPSKSAASISLVDKIGEFNTNESNSEKLMTITILDNNLLVGGRGVVYNLNLPDLKINRSLEWPSNEKAVKICLSKGKDKNECQNYIRLVTYIKPNGLMVCGTNAYNPMCRKYTFFDNKYTNETNGKKVVPYNPNHNSTWVNVDGEIYSGTVADFSSSDPLIHREPLQTKQSDDRVFNEPNFVNSMVDGNYVYFFFRERGVESLFKTVLSRIARVCKFDGGGMSKSWTTYFKARLICSTPGDLQLYFNEIQSTTGIIEGIYGGNQARLIYATFTTPVNSISGSAICAFNLADIIKTFEGEFKGPGSDKVPEPHPGTCFKNRTKNLSDETLDFIKTHPLMDESVPAYFGEPILVKTQQYRFTKIAVDPQVKTIDGKAYDVLYIGTDNGIVVKTVNAYSASSTQGVSPFIVEEWQVFEDKAIQNLQVTPDGHLIASSDYGIKSFNLHQCKELKNCHACVALRDPYCAWDKLNNRCTYVHLSDSNKENFYQSILTGIHSACNAFDKCDQNGKKNDSNTSPASVSSASDSNNGHRLFPLHGAILWILWIYFRYKIVFTKTN